MPHPKRTNECGHPERPHRAKGRCKACYERDLRAANPEAAERKRECARKWYAANPERQCENVRKWAAANPERQREYKRKWYAANSERHREIERKSHLRSKFGLDSEAYDAMLAAQGGVCAICAQTCKSGNRLAVDHCHSTGLVRGLLCGFCNRTIGYFYDDPGLLRHMADVAERAGAPHKHGTGRRTPAWFRVAADYVDHYAREHARAQADPQGGPRSAAEFAEHVAREHVSLW